MPRSRRETKADLGRPRLISAPFDYEAASQPLTRSSMLQQPASPILSHQLRAVAVVVVTATPALRIASWPFQPSQEVPWAGPHHRSGRTTSAAYCARGACCRRATTTPPDPCPRRSCARSRTTRSATWSRCNEMSVCSRPPQARIGVAPAWDPRAGGCAPRVGRLVQLGRATAHRRPRRLGQPRHPADPAIAQRPGRRAKQQPTLPLGQVRRDQGEGRRQHLIQIHWMNLASPAQPGKITERGPPIWSNEWCGSMGDRSSRLESLEVV
jgi:hypothetical protein